MILTLKTPIPQNGQTHSNNSPANCESVKKLKALKVLRNNCDFDLLKMAIRRWQPVDCPCKP